MIAGTIAQTNPILRERRIALTWLAASLNINHSTVYRWVTIGVDGNKLESFRLGKNRFTTHEAFDRWMRLTNWETLHTGGRMKQESKHARNSH